MQGGKQSGLTGEIASATAKERRILRPGQKKNCRRFFYIRCAMTPVSVDGEQQIYMKFISREEHRLFLFLCENLQGNRLRQRILPLQRPRRTMAER